MESEIRNWGLAEELRPTNENGHRNTRTEVWLSSSQQTWLSYQLIGMTDHSCGIMNTGTGGLAELLKSLFVALAANRNGGYKVNQ